MALLIELSRADIECLLDHLPQGSDLRQILGKSDSTVFTNIRAIGMPTPLVCSEVDARRFLRVARSHCPDAVEKIQEAINLSGLRSTQER